MKSTSLTTTNNESFFFSFVFCKSTLKKIISRILKIWNIFFDAGTFFSKNKNFHGNLPEAGRLRELDHQQCELERFDHYINIA
jgi:hypothetical protein